MHCPSVSLCKGLMLGLHSNHHWIHLLCGSIQLVNILYLHADCHLMTIGFTS